MVRRRLSAFVALAAITGLAVFTAGPAAAGPDRDPDLYEWNTAVAGTPPASFTKCTAKTPGVAAMACYVEGTDDLWVKDTAKDGYSAATEWIMAVPNGISLNIERWGTCVNSLGSGKWGVCRKNFTEDATLGWFAGTFDNPTDTWHYITDTVSTKA
ncbi:MAG: hypothetical protein GXX79_14595 [Actinomycetales bacterium]|nr:hypothetical protein [Actinomycetales bacterium]